MAFDSSDQLFLKSENSLHAINPATGAEISSISISDPPNLDNVLEFDPSDTLYSAERTGGDASIYTINPTTGATALVGSNSIENLTGLTFREVNAEVSGPDVDEYLLDLTGKAGQPIDIAFSTDIDLSGGDVTLELLDTDGTTVLATGMEVSDNFDLGILDFVVSSDGIYTVRVTAEAEGRYGIVVTDPLVFDTEANQPTNSPLRSLDAYESALGFLGEGTVGGDDVDTYEITLGAGEQIGLSTITRSIIRSTA